MRRRTRILVVAAAAALAAAPAGATTPARAADRLIAADPTAANVSAFGGVLAYTREHERGDFRLVIDLGGGAEDAAVRPAAHAFDPDLGPAVGGSVAAVYARCKGGRCALARLNLETGRSIALPAPPPGCSDRLPAVWRRTVAFLRECDGRRRVVVRTPRATRTVLRPAGAVAGLDLSARHVAVAARRGSATLTLVPLRGGRPFVLFEDSLNDFGVDPLVHSPAFDGTRVAWANYDYGESGGTGRLLRKRAARGARLETERRRFDAQSYEPVPQSLAADAGRLFYVGPGGLFEATDGPPAWTATNESFG